MRCVGAVASVREPHSIARRTTIPLNAALVSEILVVKDVPTQNKKPKKARCITEISPDVDLDVAPSLFDKSSLA